MRIYETLERDPRGSSLANNGQARMNDLADAKARAELRAELETFVCDGQYGDALDRILQSYLRQLDKPRQNAAWVSGFFGSGKSHLLKMLGHLWADTAVEDGVHARSLVRGLPQDVVAHLRELDGKAARIGKPLVSAWGTLPSGDNDLVRTTVLSIILRACEMPSGVPQAQFCFMLRDKGILDAVRRDVVVAGKTWERELNNLYVSGPIAQALLRHDPAFARDEREARDVLRAQFPNRTGDITVEEFLKLARRALAPDDGPLPLTALILDEVQQYIGESSDRATMVTDLAEAIQTQMDSRVLLVASGQSALSTKTPQLQKLRDRFTLSVQLSDTDVETVIRKVLLVKKPTGAGAIQTTLAQNSGEIAKHLKGTRLSWRAEDQRDEVVDYPLLPTRRRFWEECFRAVDKEGSKSQLRSQLRIVHDAVQGVAEREIGHAITADALYEALAPDLVGNGLLLNELNNRIASLDDGTDEGRLRKRLAGLVFLINKLPREAGIDTGVRATATVLADLLVDDLRADSGAFRKRVADELAEMERAGDLMKVGEEFRLQTTQGAQWESDFRSRAGAMRNDDAAITAERDSLLAAEVQSIVRSVRLPHGQAKVQRKLAVHYGDVAPTSDGESTIVWVRDEWSTAQRDVESAARAAGADDPTIHLFIPKKGADDLRRTIVDAAAAQAVIDAKGVSQTREGEEARSAMVSRRDAAIAEREALIRDIVNGAKVYKGGASEEYGADLAAKLQSAGEASLARMFPEFHHADQTANAWEAARKRAQDGSDQPLAVIQHTGPTEDHPVARVLRDAIGAGSTGSELRRIHRSAPYGWPQDAIDAVLVALVAAGHLRATANGQPVRAEALNGTMIAKAEFRSETVRISGNDKLTLRGLYKKAGVTARGGEEEAKAAVFIAELRALANRAGGDPPLPERPNIAWLDDLGRLVGNDQLKAILDQQQTIEQSIVEWQTAADLAAKRRPAWETLTKLLHHAQGLSVGAEVRQQVDAIIANRSLLDPTSDYAEPLIRQLETELRAALQAAHTECEQVFATEEAALHASADWVALPPEKRAAIGTRHHLTPLSRLSVPDTESLVLVLGQRSLIGWRELKEGLPTRFANARADAAKELEPTTQTVKLSSDTLRDEAGVRAWLAATETDLLSKLAKGPIRIG